MLDFKTCFFAVSDSSDRNPAASRDLLLRLDALFRKNCSRLDLDESGLEPFKKEAVNQASKAISAVPRTASCTLTALKFVQTEEGWKALLMHMGDSALYAYGRQSGRLTMLSQRNFWLAGKTNALYQAEWLEAEPGALWIMTSDGVPDSAMNACFGRRVNGAAPPPVPEVHEVPEALLTLIAQENTVQDDAAIIALEPGRMKPVDACIIMGGATGMQEKEYIKRCISLEYRDRNAPVDFKTPYACPVI
ncbi:SpoIIE family protein phosphatase [Desulfatibacillum aliphaticivorans]|uniref:SpoIIE family protein phosphatase n=1 Tax=Desulfatibacillum aliphaticivorans TaxID=218208 RepID=UPI001472224D|nr:SpoIIE family protein phosphatase [Desulfatibacillum aliphaticivorans]